ncbi:MAG: recombination regulator RecX [Halomonas subglaciescola]|nr:recombination regulator RecX [Halomonas subglaciescola]
MAMNFLARREYSRAELEERLGRKGVEADGVATCLDRLAEQGLQSDARFAASFVRTRVLRGQGARRIQSELFQRGVEPGVQRQVLADVVAEENVDWFELARETLARRFDTPGDTPRERARRERFLASRGFEFEQIRHALASL